MEREAAAFRRAFTLRLLRYRAETFRAEMDPDERAEFYAEAGGDCEEFATALLDEEALEETADAILEELFPGWDGAHPVDSLVDQELLAKRAQPIVEELCSSAEVRADELGLLEDDD